MSNSIRPRNIFRSKKIDWRYHANGCYALFVVAAILGAATAYFAPQGLSVIRWVAAGLIGLSGMSLIIGVLFSFLDNFMESRPS